ncbi:MAG: addiction module protein [Flavobacteriales bacterium]|nr:addiction module protein [Flavobacteriales bacterium]
MSIQEIQSLSNAEKILLVEQIWDSIDKNAINLSVAQKKELDKRLEQHAKGETKFRSWDEVKKRLHNRG